MDLQSKAETVALVQEACACGARVKQACEALDLPFRTYLRWSGNPVADRRKTAQRAIPRKLKPEEVQAFYQVANAPRFCDKTPGQIVASLLEEGIYYGSERTLYRILKSRRALAPRTESRTGIRRHKPQELRATGPNQVWSWDITWLKTDVKGVFLYGYVILDIYSRAVIGWSLETEETPDLARRLFERVSRDHGLLPQFVHADNGAPMRGLSLVAFLVQMKVGLSYSRPRVSDDNPFIESFFKTLKYRVGYPKLFKDLVHARSWFAQFVNWYNTCHQHSGIQYVTPWQKHQGLDRAILATRQATLNAAAIKHPARFVRGPRTIPIAQAVTLNKAS